MEMEMLATTATEKATVDRMRDGTRRLMRRILPAIPVMAAPLLVAAMAAAESNVGQSAVVIRDVQGTLQENVRSLVNADPVFQDELVATAERSASEIRFLDHRRGRGRIPVRDGQHAQRLL
jgi:hypothetical protein